MRIRDAVLGLALIAALFVVAALTGVSFGGV